MKTKIFILVCLLFFTQTLLSQSKGTGTLKVLAVLVDFREDRDTRTYGNGKFGTIYTEDYGLDILDPLPHDAEYFSDHMEFVKNYFNRVSKSKFTVESNVLVDVFTVSQTMSEYSPDDTSSTYGRLAVLASETWTLVNEANPSFNYGDYDMFVIFHAGVSKGLALPGSLGLEKDLPSIYFNHEALKKVFGSNFPGFAMGDGSFITNTAILPETDSREIEGFGTKSLIELTINGYICATVGSHIGVPDLFDTEEGNSIIGRYGLMDPQGFYAYNGMYPPAPSAWTIEYLGWIDPVVISSGDRTINLTANEIATALDTTVVKIPLNSTEYYLIENRVRDANKDGSILTYKVGGEIKTLTIPYDQDGYWYHTADTINGVLIDIDEPDWAVPGIDDKTEDDTFSDCGIVIWHIDNDVIKNSFDNNKINANPDRRGIYIEEADGIYDLGETFYNLLTGSTDAREAYKEDSWYKSNPAELYENKFNADTRPNTNTNTDAASLISLSDFSDEGLTMSFKLKFGSDVIKKISHNVLPLEGEADWFTNSSNFGYYTQSEKTAYRIENNGNSSVIPEFESTLKPAVAIINSFEIMIGGVADQIKINIFNGTSHNVTSHTINEQITSSIVIKNVSSDEIAFYVGTGSGSIKTYKINTSSELTLIEENNPFTDAIKYIATDGTTYCAATENGIIAPDGSVLQIETVPIQGLVFLEATNGCLVKTKQKIYIINSASDYSEFETLNESVSFAVADLKNDGENYLVSLETNSVVAYNLSGAVADYFPIKDYLSNDFISTPLCFDLDNDDKSEILLFSKDGRISAYNTLTGDLFPGYPISSGSSLSASPVLTTQNNKTSLALINDDNLFAIWNISEVDGKKFWSSELGDAYNSSSVDAAENSGMISEFFPASKAYNWPNPVYENETFFRYYVADDSKISIKIFDLAGELVDELSAEAIGGFDNEISWNVSDIQSGVYLARIEAIGYNGNNGSKLVKVSIIK